MPKIFPLFIFLCHSLNGIAQTDSTMILPEAKITAFKIPEEGTGTWNTEKSIGPQTGAQVLQNENPLMLRTNGPGLLSSLSIRGAGPARSPVYWEGLPLLSPMNGTYDASLLSMWPDDQLQVRYGGQSGVLGNAAISGAVFTGGETVDSSRLARIGLEAGSFDNWIAHASVYNRLRNSLGRTRLLVRQGQNRFPFQNTSQIGAPQQRQQNSFLRIADLQHLQTWNLQENYWARLVLWVQDSYRQIPPTMTESPVNRLQKDRSLRGVLSWGGEKKIGSLPLLQVQGKIAYSNEFIEFTNLNLVDSSAATMLRFEGKARLSFSNGWKLAGSLLLQQLQGRSDGYDEPGKRYTESRPGLFITLEKNFRKTALNFSMRQSFLNGESLPISGAFSGRYFPGPDLTLRWHLSRNYNLPTFNDRYWAGLGNPELLAEKGYSADLAVEWNSESQKAALSVFNLLMDNWIQWQPGQDGQFRPVNLRQVWSRGVEAQAEIKLPTEHISSSLRGRYQFVLTTTVRNYICRQHTPRPATAVYAKSPGKYYLYGLLEAIYLELHAAIYGTEVY